MWLPSLLQPCKGASAALGPHRSHRPPKAHSMNCLLHVFFQVVVFPAASTCVRYSGGVSQCGCLVEKNSRCDSLSEQRPGNKWEISHGSRDLLESEVFGVEGLAFS